ncbi:hypothetical protein F383_34719 [Gossypium arboreum]|uniref:Uncharacterized protein n=1 Tax=Gossypium arboreum TaxID=29729 RepID=A0A0B0PLP8_GOSAR|nr:hypothetical protein F383_34719 [Gossypium arboreum]
MGEKYGLEMALFRPHRQRHRMLRIYHRAWHTDVCLGHVGIQYEAHGCVPAHVHTRGSHGQITCPCARPCVTHG